VSFLLIFGGVGLAIGEARDEQRRGAGRGRHACCARWWPTAVCVLFLPSVLAAIRERQRVRLARLRGEAYTPPAQVRRRDAVPLRRALQLPASPPRHRMHACCPMRMRRSSAAACVLLHWQPSWWWRRRQRDHHQLHWRRDDDNDGQPGQCRGAGAGAGGPARVHAPDACGHEGEPWARNATSTRGHHPPTHPQLRTVPPPPSSSSSPTTLLLRAAGHPRRDAARWIPAREPTIPRRADTHCQWRWRWRWRRADVRFPVDDDDADGPSTIDGVLWHACGHGRRHADGHDARQRGRAPTVDGRLHDDGAGRAHDLARRPKHRLRHANVHDTADARAAACCQWWWWCQWRRVHAAAATAHNRRPRGRQPASDPRADSRVWRHAFWWRLRLRVAGHWLRDAAAAHAAACRRCRTARVQLARPQLVRVFVLAGWDVLHGPVCTAGFTRLLVATVSSSS